MRLRRRPWRSCWLGFGLGHRQRGGRRQSGHAGDAALRRVAAGLAAAFPALRSVGHLALCPGRPFRRFVGGEVGAFRLRREDLPILPLAFLSGTFYLQEDLPPLGRALLDVNPAFYAFDGFRADLLGYADSAAVVGFGYLSLLCLGLVLLAWRLGCTGLAAQGLRLGDRPAAVFAGVRPQPSVDRLLSGRFSRRSGAQTAADR